MKIHSIGRNVKITGKFLISSQSLLKSEKHIKSGNCVKYFVLDKKPARYFFYTFEIFHIIFNSLI